jgi:outer membrane lipoprotein-sorting protein
METLSYTPVHAIQRANIQLLILSILGVLPIFAIESGPELFAKVTARNQMREAQLTGYTVVRTYEVKDANGRVQAQSKVLVKYNRPNPKVFQVLSEQGSRLISRLVFRGLTDHEAKTSSADAKNESGILPANYDVQLAGEAELEGRHCFLLHATPRRRVKYLFEGTIWIDAEDLAIAQVEGSPAKSLSFWVKSVHFVRRYQKIGNFWLPKEDTSVSEVKVFGKHTLVIHYDDYKLDASGEQPSS